MRRPISENTRYELRYGTLTYTVFVWAVAIVWSYIFSLVGDKTAVLGWMMPAAALICTICYAVHDYRRFRFGKISYICFLIDAVLLSASVVINIV